MASSISPIPARDYVVSGLIEEATVNALLAFGQPMITEPDYGSGRRFRAWVRLRCPYGCERTHNRTFGR